VQGLVGGDIVKDVQGVVNGMESKGCKQGTVQAMESVCGEGPANQCLPCLRARYTVMLRYLTPC